MSDESDYTHHQSESHCRRRDVWSMHHLSTVTMVELWDISSFYIPFLVEKSIRNINCLLACLCVRRVKKTSIQVAFRGQENIEPGRLPRSEKVAVWSIHFVCFWKANSSIFFLAVGISLENINDLIARLFIETQFSDEYKCLYRMKIWGEYSKRLDWRLIEIDKCECSFSCSPIFSIHVLPRMITVFYKEDFLQT